MPDPVAEIAEKTVADPEVVVAGSGDPNAQSKAEGNMARALFGAPGTPEPDMDEREIVKAATPAGEPDEKDILKVGRKRFNLNDIGDDDLRKKIVEWDSAERETQSVKDQLAAKTAEAETAQRELSALRDAKVPEEPTPVVKAPVEPDPVVRDPEVDSMVEQLGHDGAKGKIATVAEMEGQAGRIKDLEAKIEALTTQTGQYAPTVAAAAEEQRVRNVREMSRDMLQESADAKTLVGVDAEQLAAEVQADQRAARGKMGENAVTPLMAMVFGYRRLAGHAQRQLAKALSGKVETVEGNPPPPGGTGPGEKKGARAPLGPQKSFWDRALKSFPKP